MRIRPGRAIRNSLCLIVFQAICFSSPGGVSYGQGGGGVDMIGTGGKHSINGRIYFPSGQRADVRIKVKLVSVQYSELTVLADLNGTFGFKSLAPGSYTIVVEGGEEYETTREGVFIDGDGSNPRAGVIIPTIPRAYQVQIYLQPKRVTVTKPVVINAELASVPEPAKSLYQKAVSLGQAGESDKAIEQLKQAISYYPDFALALNELGIQWLKVAKPSKAAEVLSTAVKLKPDAFTPRLNYGIALLELRESSAAEAQLREALKRNDNSAIAHMYLGITLVSLRNYEEAEKELLRSIGLAGNGIGLAHYYLGGIYWHKKQYKLAADELEIYLKQTPNAADAKRVRETIKDLRSKS